MTYKEAIELIRSTPLYRHDKENGRQSDLFKALDLAVKALEKQMPKNVIYHDNYGNPTPNQARCPRCYEASNDTWHWAGESYCEYCGQLMKWSE